LFPLFYNFISVTDYFSRAFLHPIYRIPTGDPCRLAIILISFCESRSFWALIYVYPILGSSVNSISTMEKEDLLNHLTNQTEQIHQKMPALKRAALLTTGFAVYRNKQKEVLS
jgi:hypothetical protein